MSDETKAILIFINGDVGKVKTDLKEVYGFDVDDNKCIIFNKDFEVVHGNESGLKVFAEFITENIEKLKKHIDLDKLFPGLKRGD